MFVNFILIFSLISKMYVIITELKIVINFIHTFIFLLLMKKLIYSLLIPNLL